MKNDTMPPTAKAEFFKNLIATYTAIYAHIQWGLAGSGLTVQQASVLYHLYLTYPARLSMGQLKEKMIFPHSDLTRLCDRLIQKELVVRVENTQDRRLVYLKLTAEAYTYLHPIVAQVLNIETFLDVVTPTEVAVANALFYKIRTSL